ncbi:MAG TPA: hypothetical protein VJT73_19030 [Polyangiaceae bacterium]|nr:hypothetical protein [Polyangiaceae bacterium]
MIERPRWRRITRGGLLAATVGLSGCGIFGGQTGENDGPAVPCIRPSDIASDPASAATVSAVRGTRILRGTWFNGEPAPDLTLDVMVGDPIAEGDLCSTPLALAIAGHAHTSDNLFYARASRLTLPTATTAMISFAPAFLAPTYPRPGAPDSGLVSNAILTIETTSSVTTAELRVEELLIARWSGN